VLRPTSGSMAGVSGGFGEDAVREESGLVGVGIVFQPVEDGTLYVKRMRQDSPAARSGLIQVGDCLCEVNGRSPCGPHVRLALL